MSESSSSAVFCCLALCLSRTGVADSDEQIVSALLARHSALQSVSLRLTQHIDYINVPKLDLTQQNIVLLDGRHVSNVAFHFHNGLVRYEQEFIDNPGGQSHDARQIFARNGVRCETLREFTSGKVVGAISDHGSLPVDMLIDVALGLRRKDEAQSLAEADWRAVTIRVDDAVAHATMDCPDTEGRRHEWEFAISDGIPLRTYRILQGDVVLSMFTCKEFTRFGSIDVPTHVEMTEYHEFGGTRVPYRTVTLSEVEYSTNDRSNAAFEIEWPLQAAVHDERTGVSVKIATQPQVLTDEIMSSLVPRAQTVPRQSADRVSHLGRRTLVWANLFVLFMLILFVVYRNRLKDR